MLVYVLAVLSSTALVFDAPEASRAHVPDGRARGAAQRGRAQREPVQRLPGRGPRDRGRADRRFRRRVCFAINTVAFIAVLASLLLMRTSELVPSRPQRRPPAMLRGIREGVPRWVLASPQMRLVLAIVTVVSTVGFNFHVILPLLASGQLQAGPEVFGILSASFGGGALVGAHCSPPRSGRASWKVLVAGTGGFLLLLALAPHHSLGVRCCSCSSPVSASLWTSNANSILQLQAPDHLRGRVVSLSTSGPSPGSPRRRPARRLAHRRGRHAACVHGRRRHRADDVLAARELTRRYPGRVRFGFTRP